MSKRKFYAVVKGYEPGIYDEWFGPAGAQAQIRGFPNAHYKGFATLGDADAWYIQQVGGPPPRHLVLPKPDEQTATRLAIDPATALRDGKVVIYSDGACEGNPGRGGYGAVVCVKETRKELSGGFAQTTNNRMEITAAIMALQSLEGLHSVVLYSDSSYLVNGIQKGWAKQWRMQGWRRRTQGTWEQVKNADLWEQLLALCELHTVEFVQVPGHAGVVENERCDRLAVQASQRPGLPADHGFETATAKR